jgi:pimeloyl-ACP methyl ester carboxylesterase
MLAALAESGRALLPSNVEMKIVEGAGHFLQLESPETVGDLIADFIGTA